MNGLFCFYITTVDLQYQIYYTHHRFVYIVTVGVIGAMYGF